MCYPMGKEKVDDQENRDAAGNAKEGSDTGMLKG